MKSETTQGWTMRVARRYRGVAARANYLSLDRVDLQFASKEACRQMSNPRVTGEARMKRIARYLLKYPKLVWKHDRGKTDEHVIDVFSDSDWLHVDDLEDPQSFRPLRPRTY